VTIAVLSELLTLDNFPQSSYERQTKEVSLGVPLALLHGKQVSANQQCQQYLNVNI